MGRTTRTTTAVCLAITLGLAGCGDDSSANGDDTSTDMNEAGDAVAITAVNYAFEGVPGSVAAGTELTLTNASDDEVHEIVALRIPDDEGRSGAELIALPEEELNAIFPEDQMPATVVIAPPGEDGFPVLGDGTLGEPGRYVLVCFIPTGADPAEYLAAGEEAEDGPPDVEGGPPHMVQGMFTELTVE